MKFSYERSYNDLNILFGKKIIWKTYFFQIQSSMQARICACMKISFYKTKIFVVLYTSDTSGLQFTSYFYFRFLAHHIAFSIDAQDTWCQSIACLVGHHINIVQPVLLESYFYPV